MPYDDDHEESDPSKISPNNSNHTNNGSDHRAQNIYSLGILSADHLDKQPSTSGNASTASAPQEVVKVQFIQSGGKVVPVKPSPTTGGSNTPEATPKHKTKKKLSKILAFGMAPKKPKAKPPASKYQNFSDDDGEGEEGEEEDGVSLQESTSTMGESIASSSAASWKDVDAAIPVLQL